MKQQKEKKNTFNRNAFNCGNTRRYIKSRHTNKTNVGNSPITNILTHLSSPFRRNTHDKKKKQ